MEKTFGGFPYVEMEVPLELIDPSPTQPTSRNDMESARRKTLLRSIGAVGIKDRADLIRLGDRFQIIEGHGRDACARILGLKTLPAKVFSCSPEDHAKLRDLIFSAEAAKMKMTGNQYAEYSLREEQLGNTVNAPRDVDDYNKFTSDNFSMPEREWLIADGIGPQYLKTARTIARIIIGADGMGAYPQSDEAQAMLVRVFKWNVEFHQQRAIIQRPKSRGASFFRNLLDDNKPLRGVGRETGYKGLSGVPSGLKNQNKD